MRGIVVESVSEAFRWMPALGVLEPHDLRATYAKLSPDSQPGFKF